MPLVSLEPESFELPDLRLVGTCSFADYFANEQWPQIGETWERFIKLQGGIPNPKAAGRCFGLELYPAGFPADHRWYYMACTEVEGLEEPFPSGMLSRYIPACQYVKFTVRGPVTEIAPAFQYIYKDWLPKSGVKIAGTYDLELYDSRFIDPCSADSLVDILLPLADAQNRA